jgi:YidC/Oxa1 family membrane protein insertase
MNRLAILLALFALGWCWALPEARASELPAPAPIVVEREGQREILVSTKLAEYLFSSTGGVLQSVYLRFTPLGTVAEELIPDTETRLDPQSGQLQRSYVRNAFFPFQLVVNGRSTEDLEHVFTWERSGEQLALRFLAEIEGLRVTKTFLVSENPYYTVEFQLELANMTDEPLTLARGLQLALGHGLGRPGGPPPKVRYLFAQQLTDRPLQSSGLSGLGFVGQGLIFFLKEIEAGGPVLPVEGDETGHPAGLGLEFAPITLPTREARLYAYELYAGRAKYTLLEHAGLGQLAPPDFLSQFLIPVVQLLDWLYRGTSNYGWAIILFTLITRILLFPLTRKQFHAMAKMAELRPKLEKLQQRYPTLRRLKELHPNLSQEELFKRDRENRRALQEKMMELYREEQVNPLGGCLPLLVQFPILIILWQAILYSAETIHLSPGFLWMNDLSLRDPYYLIVALTAAAMILQTKTTPTLTTSTQGPNPMIFMLFSIALMVVFLKDFPSGLWLYYFLTTVIQVGQQVFINWEMKRIRLQKAAAPEPALPEEGELPERSGPQ